MSRPSSRHELRRSHSLHMSTKTENSDWSLRHGSSRQSFTSDSQVKCKSNCNFTFIARRKFFITLLYFRLLQSLPGTRESSPIPYDYEPPMERSTHKARKMSGYPYYSIMDLNRPEHYRRYSQIDLGYYRVHFSYSLALCIIRL